MVDHVGASNTTKIRRVEVLDWAGAVLAGYEPCLSRDPSACGIKSDYETPR